MEPESARRSITVYSLSSLAEELNQGETIEDVTFYPQGVDERDKGEVARKAIGLTLLFHCLLL